MSSSVDGLVSGLSTSSMIQQLMTVEAASQTKLKSTLSNEQTVIKSYQAVNGKMSSLQTAAEALTSATAWTGMKASSNSPAISVAATSSAAAGQLSFDVTQLARAEVRTALTPPTGDVVGAGGLDITIGTGPTAVVTNIPLTALKTNTAQGVADAINAKGLSVRAAVVTSDNGPMLQFTSTKTGEANAFTVDGLLNPDGTPGGTTKIAVYARDAKLRVGDPPPTDGSPPADGGYTISSASNTFTNVMPGLTVTATDVTTTQATVTIVSDSGKLADQMQAMVDATNAALDGISAESSYDPTTKTGGPLLSDSNTRFMAQRLLGAVSNGKSGYGSFSQLGLSLDQTGKLTFDRNAFLTAQQADPAKVQDAVQKGIAATLAAEGKGATNSANGSITLAIQGRNSKIKDLTDQIADWDVRLKTRQDALQRQFANLEVSLGKLKDQSAWLAGQIGSLPSAASAS